MIIIIISRYVERYGLTEPSDDIWKVLRSFAEKDEKYNKRLIDGEWSMKGR